MDSIAFAVAGTNYGGWTKNWQFVSICNLQIMARERLRLTSWNLGNEKYTDERFDWQVKCDVFVDSMAPWTIEYNLNISLLLSLHKIRSSDFPTNFQTAYYN